MQNANGDIDTEEEKVTQSYADRPDVMLYTIEDGSTDMTSCECLSIPLCSLKIVI